MTDADLNGWKWHYVYFEDQAPAIGAGWRPVMAKAGWKWVKLRIPGRERGTKIRRSVWDTLKKAQRAA